MKKHGYIKEIHRRFWKRIEMRWGKRRTIIALILSLVIMNVITYLINIRNWGVDTANQELISNLIMTAGVELLLIAYFSLSWRYYEIPEEIYIEQNKILEDLSPGKLDISVGPSTQKEIVTEDGENIPIARLVVINHGNKKIVEFNVEMVELLQKTADLPKDAQGTKFYTGRETFYFVWQNGEIFNSLLPGKTDEIQIAELHPLNNNPLFGKEKYRAAPFGEEAIYDVNLQLQGKLEGESEFKMLKYQTELYCNPEKNILEFAEVSFSIPSRLVDRLRDALKDIKNI